MTLKGEWQKEQIDALNKLAGDLWSGWYYDTYIFDEFSAENLSSAFSGCGRWVFENNLESIGEWTEEANEDRHPGILGAYRTLVKGMEAGKLSINVTYYDEESGQQVLYKQEGSIRAQGGSLVYEKQSEEDFDYTWKNVINITGETDTFHELVASLAGKASVTEDGIEEIKAWAMQNTCPHSTEFDYLPSELRTDFEDLFCCE
jgi:hypothetical protein